MTRRTWARRTRVRRAVIVTVGLLVLALVGLEIFLRRAYGLGDVPVVVSDPTMEYRYAPDRHYRRKGNRIDINAYSMRSDPFPPRKASPAERRVMVIGDSIVNGAAQLDQAQVVTSLLQARLRRDVPAAGLIVGNISVGSWGPQNQLAYVERFGLFDADVAVIVASGHDATDEMGPLSPEVRVISQTYWSALGEARMHLWARFAGSPDAFVPGPPGRAEPCLAAFDELLARVARDTGRPAIVVLHASRDESAADGESSGHALLRAACARRGIEPIAMRDAQRASLAAGHETFVDALHPSVAGHALMADAIAPAVQAALARPAEPATRPR